MNVLLVCGNGITTNMLSARLQKYAQEQGKRTILLPPGWDSTGRCSPTLTWCSSPPRQP